MKSSKPPKSKPPDESDEEAWSSNPPVPSMKSGKPRKSSKAWKEDSSSSSSSSSSDSSSIALKSYLRHLVAEFSHAFPCHGHIEGDNQNMELKKENSELHSKLRAERSAQGR